MEKIGADGEKKKITTRCSEIDTPVYISDPSTNLAGW